MPETFAAWLQAQLDRLGVDGVGAAARALGVSQSMISNWLNGHTLPSRRSVKKLAAALDAPAATIDALLFLEDERRRGRHVPGLGPTGADDEDDAGITRPEGLVVSTPTAAVRIDDPRLVGYFYGFLSKWARMTEEERESLLADEVEIPEPPTTGGDGDAGGGGAGPGGAR